MIAYELCILEAMCIVLLLGEIQNLKGQLCSITNEFCSVHLLKLNDANY